MKTINSFRSKLLALILALVASVSTFAYEFEYSNDFHIDGFAYKVLPSNTLWPYGAVALIEIADCAADVIIPDTITYTFSNTTVTYIVTTLGGGAALFTNSAKETVKSISIPKGISVINSPLFAGCSNLTSIVVDSENPYYDSRENCNAIITTSQNPYFTPNTLIAGCQTTVIPHSVAEIADKAFYNSALESITIPTGVTKIGRSAFNNSNQLSSVTLPASLKEIGDWAFADCLSLNTIICYALVPPTVSSYTFQGSNPIYNNPTVYVPAESVEAYKNAEHWKWFLQILPIEKNPKDLFPTLWGLQRTSFTKYFDSGHQPESEPHLLKAGDTKWIGGNLYLDFGQYLREENGKIYIYSELLQKDFVLYDFTLELGDTLTTLNWDYNNPNSDGTISVVDYAVDCPIDTLIVTDISTITLLDGKEYKKWIFNHGYFGYVESIGTLSGLFYELSQSCMVVPGCYMGDHLVCASRNGKLLYQMDDEEMERLGAECLCDYNSGPKKDNAKNGKIGGRPTPTQWNMLEVETKEMDGTPTILRAETFSYTLENDSIVTKGKTYYQLARQSTKDTAITKSFVGALHFGEDEDNRVYFFRDGHEYVLYDFTAEPGDTLEIFAGINNYPQDSTYTHVVIGKDTIENGACRMTLEVVFPDETTAENAEKVWLAGLGSIDGIVHNAAKRTSNAHAAPSRTAHSSETQTSVMLCAWREDSCLYTTDHPDYDTYGCVYNQDPTALESPTSPSSYQKILHEGKLMILHSGKIYNVLGVSVK